MERNLISFTKFSKEILESGDIDPDYHFMREFAKSQKMPKEKVLRWICLKSAIYRSVSELQVMLDGKDYSEVKFGNERNKHRAHAQKYSMALASFLSSFPPEKATKIDWFNSLVKVDGVGPWARWKIIDLLSCVYGFHIDLSKVDFRQAYEFPLKGLCLVNDLPEQVSELYGKNRYEQAMKEAWKQMPKVKKSPHNDNKGIRINELETCLCKYHSYVHGHYYPGKDLEHLKKDIAESELKQLKKFKWSL